MPKLKPIKDEKELAAVPLDEPVLVELEPPASGAEPEIEARTEPEREANTDTDGVAALKTQLQASKDAERRERDRATAAEARATEAAAEAARLKTANGDTEKELLSNSLSSAQSEEAAAKLAFKTAFESGDADAMADAQSKIGRAAAKVLHFEGAVAQLDEEATLAAEEAKTPKTEQPVDIVTAIDRDPNLMPKERDWLKEHTHVLTDPKTNRELSVGYDRALAKGFKRGSEGYFKFLDEFMGFAKEPPAAAEEPETETDTTERASIVSAPVARDNRSLSGRPTAPTRIMLTPEQRDLARSMGLSDVQYARGKVQLDANKKADPERFAGR